MSDIAVDVENFSMNRRNYHCKLLFLSAYSLILNNWNYEFDYWTN